MAEQAWSLVIMVEGCFLVVLSLSRFAFIHIRIPKISNTNHLLRTRTSSFEINMLGKTKAGSILKWLDLMNVNGLPCKDFFKFIRGKLTFKFHVRMGLITLLG